MPLAICKYHGRQPAEKVSKILLASLEHDQDISTRMRDYSFVMEDVEWPFYGLQEEMAELPEMCANGDILINNDERLNEVLGRITVVCLACLKEAMHGSAFPNKGGGQ